MQKNIKNKININDPRGFTLIEVLVAVSIFVVSITALMVLLGKGISDVSIARNKLIANYMAQEGIELVRYNREYNALYNGANGWSGFETGILNCQTGAPLHPCGVSALHPTDPMVSCLTSAACTVTVEPASGAYGISGSAPTIFNRQIYIDPPTGSDVVVVHSVVTWTQGLSNYSASMSEALYNW